MNKHEWVWQPHAGHFICGSYCRFHLNTYLGNGFLVSTVGEYFPDSAVRKIFAECRNVEIIGRGDDWDRDYMEKIGYEQLGLDRTYETMVFEAKEISETNICCKWRINPALEVDMRGYNDPNEAYQGHLVLCEKWSDVGFVNDFFTTRIASKRTFGAAPSEFTDGHFEGDIQ